MAEPDPDRGDVDGSAPDVVAFVVPGGDGTVLAEAHDMIMSTFGSLSKGERNRIRIRVRAAMAAQAQMGGRYLGGRPPYGTC